MKVQTSEGVLINSKRVEIGLQKQLMLATLLNRNRVQSGDMNMSFITSTHIAIFLTSYCYRIFSYST
jgi:hypothetical protein